MQLNIMRRWKLRNNSPGQMNESQQSSKHMTSKNQNTWNGKTETSLSNSLKRALLCSIRQERGRRSANSAFLCFFQWKAHHHRNFPPFAFVPVFPVEMHFSISNKWPAEVNELLVAATQHGWGRNNYSLEFFYWLYCAALSLTQREEY